NHDKSAESGPFQDKKNPHRKLIWSKYEPVNGKQKRSDSGAINITNETQRPNNGDDRDAVVAQRRGVPVHCLTYEEVKYAVRWEKRTTEKFNGYASFLLCL
ncbi:MAG: hypothetical protein WBN03_09735, partial [Desulfobacterales bacterium]